MTFSDFNFDEHLMEGLASMGYVNPTPIQEQAIPAILDGHDVIACAQTGTGKTAAYILPILQKVLHTEHRHLTTLVLAPTRELAQQIDQQIEGFAYFMGISSIAVYGGGDGAAWDKQKKALESGADIIIATPGRLIALLAAGTLNLQHLRHLVLDEADRMLDMGFYADIIRIINYLPEQRQTLLFSATMPPKIRTLANRILHSPREVNLAVSKPAEGIQQQAYILYEAQKIPMIKWILGQEDHSSVLIFASTKENVKKLTTQLKSRGLYVKAFHSDLEQHERDEILREFKSRKLPIIVGTDILSRGIDVEGISLVINFDVPPDSEDYVHRIGRTARADRTGTAVTFVNEKDQRRFADIERFLGKEVPKMQMPADIGAGPEYRKTGTNHKPWKQNSGKKRRPTSSSGSRKGKFRKSRRST
ncbi:MAG TPA: DEAD/DEAH box helicase [Cyclobacteriaceae bacterium]